MHKGKTGAVLAIFSGGCMAFLPGSYAACESFSTVTGGGSIGRINVAREPGATPFAKDFLVNWFPFHRIEHLNSGVHGNDNAWVASGRDSFCGISFSGTNVVSAVAFGRDNTGKNTDRSAGRYTLQYTTSPNPDKSTPDSAWQTIGSVTNTLPIHALRQEFCFPPVNATGIRLLVSTDVNHPSSGGIAVDELEVLRDTTGQSEPDTDGDGLTDSYEIGSARYRIIEGAFTWDEAKVNAEQLGGHLATIVSEAEWKAILAAVGEPIRSGGIWLGANDDALEGKWEWVTGEPFAYARWAEGEPNDTTGHENNLVTHTPELWNDGQRISRFSYLLEHGYFTDPQNPDSDGDGYSDGEETLKFSTIPTDAASKPPGTRLKVSGRGYAPASGFRFSIVGTGSHSVEVSTNLLEWQHLDTVNGLSPFVFTDLSATNVTEKRFYRTITRPE